MFQEVEELDSRLPMKREELDKEGTLVSHRGQEDCLRA